ncbi:MAG TPA: hypothetical protein VEU30_15210, partial [Thermoanaerobaculia bacterium]|nr:hypothetical protein [Thermoanaerobaculia bacterium]
SQFSIRRPEAGVTAKLMLAVVTFGHVHAEDIVALTPHFSRIEQLVLDVAPRASMTEHRAELNRAVDAATADWVLVIRERETIDDALAVEIAKAAVEAKARGFRIRAVPFYAGKPLRIQAGEGELRLFHRRFLLRRGEMAVQGSVVRLANELRSVTFATSEEHREHLAKQSKPRPVISRALLFARYVVGTRARDANTLRYLWIEAGYAVTP